MSAVYGKSLSQSMQWRIAKAQLFDKGHSYQEINQTNFADICDVLGYWNGTAKVERRKKKQRASKPRPSARRRRGRRR